ncbi:hypothetical protein WMY93_031181 [Mugilogobius chulae]|uniref:DDE Tnp4 domain-containing protein n=1 Tax=Mugilogobius chulae TaxID=88201 RepID=A0AAW0MN52_9GOBI
MAHSHDFELRETGKAADPWNAITCIRPGLVLASHSDPGAVGESPEREWWEKVVLLEFGDNEWRENFRMNRASFIRLCVMVDSFMRPAETTVRTPVPLPMRVAIVLYKLGSCGEYRLVANQFGVHKSTVKKFVYMFCRGMVDNVVSNFIKVPDLAEATQIAAQFQRAFGLPQIIGCIDGSHIPMPPSDGLQGFGLLRAHGARRLSILGLEASRVFPSDLLSGPPRIPHLGVLSSSPSIGPVLLCPPIQLLPAVNSFTSSSNRPSHAAVTYK